MVIDADADADVATAADERRHLVGSSPWWGETWGFDVADAAHDMAAFVELTVHPRRRTCWFVAAVRRAGHPYVLCRDQDLGPPADPLEVRGTALWSHLICEKWFEHWTVAMEAFAVALDPPSDAWHGERGDRVGLAFDLEWESAVLPSLHRDGAVSGYELQCTVHGTMQVGDDALNIAGTGRRTHRWGALDPDWLQATSPADASPDGPTWPWSIHLEDGLLRLSHAPERDLHAGA